MEFVELFAGAGGGLLAGALLKHTPVAVCELNNYCNEILRLRQKDGIFSSFDEYTDICSIADSEFYGVSLLCGGFPCQAFSHAAHGNNTAINLWPEMFRIIKGSQPPLVFAENVNKKAINAACDDLESVGYSTRAIVLGAGDLGAPHERSRCWLLAYTDSGRKLLSAKHAKAPWLPKVHENLWETYSWEFRVLDGLAPRMERLKACGNGQVPYVAAKAFELLVTAILEDNES